MDTKVMTTRLSRRQVLGRMAGAGVAALAATTVGRAVAQDVDPTHHTEERYTATANVNMRTGPTHEDPVILVIPQGAILTLREEEPRNGFLPVTYFGHNGWAHSDFIVPTDDDGAIPPIVGEAPTTANVNLRAGAGSHTSVLLVVPTGAWLSISNVVSNGYRWVIYQETIGWVLDDFIALESTNDAVDADEADEAVEADDADDADDAVDAEG